MKKFTRLSAALFMAMAMVSGTAVSVGAVGCPVSLPDCGSLGSCVITPNGCNTFSGSDISNVLNQCTNGNCDVQSVLNQCSGGNCNIQTVLNQCSDGSCDINDIIAKCGLLPNNEQCTDCDDSKAAQPTAPVTPTTPTQPTMTTPTTTETATPSVPTTTTDSSVSEYEKQVVTLVNQYRAENGLAPLTLNMELSKVARLKSQDMKDKNYFSHTSPTYGSPFDMMKQFGISYRTAGENIAMGQQTPEAVMTAWMNSEGHRANILNSSYTQIGVGYVADGNYWTQMFIS